MNLIKGPKLPSYYLEHGCVQGLREARYSPLPWGNHLGCGSQGELWNECNKHILGVHFVYRLRCAELRSIRAWQSKHSGFD